MGKGVAFQRNGCIVIHMETTNHTRPIRCTLNGEAAHLTYQGGIGYVISETATRKWAEAHAADIMTRGGSFTY